MTVGELANTSSTMQSRSAPEKAPLGAHSRVVAAVAKIMSNKDLILAAAKIRNVTRCRIPWVSAECWHTRPANHPADDVGESCSLHLRDCLWMRRPVIGVNPASDSIETVGSILHGLARLVDAYKFQRKLAVSRTSQRNLLPSPAELRRSAFSVRRGTEAANRSFGITLKMLREGASSFEHHRQRDVHCGARMSCILKRAGKRTLRRSSSWSRSLTLEGRAYPLPDV